MTGPGALTRHSRPPATPPPDAPTRRKSGDPASFGSTGYLLHRQAGSGTPLLIVYALVNRPSMMDLQEDRSLIRGLLAQGLDVYLIDWGYPDGADRFTTLADYIERFIPRCVEEILRLHRIEKLNLLGVCQGGVMSLCHAALHPERVRNLITMVTPVDFLHAR